MTIIETMKPTEHEIILIGLRELQTYVEGCTKMPSETACAILKDINDIRLKVISDKLKNITSGK